MGIGIGFTPHQYDSQSAIFAANDRQMARANSPIIDFDGAKADELAMVAFGAQKKALEAMENEPHKPTDAGKTYNTFNAMA